MPDRFGDVPTPLGSKAIEVTFPVSAISAHFSKSSADARAPADGYSPTIFDRTPAELRLFGELPSGAAENKRSAPTCISAGEQERRDSLECSPEFGERVTSPTDPGTRWTDCLHQPVLRVSSQRTVRERTYQ